MTNRLFWKLGLTHLGLLLLVLLGVDIYAVRALRHEYLKAALAQLESLSHLAKRRFPPENHAALEDWTLWIAQGGARVTLVAADGRILADSLEDRRTAGNFAEGAEIGEALASAEGRAMGHRISQGRNQAYLAVRYEPNRQAPLVIRFSVPLDGFEQTLTSFRWLFWGASLLILALAGSVSLLFVRNISGRIERLREFSLRIAGGDFRPLPLDRAGDELAGLSEALNQTAIHLDRTIRTLTEEHNQSAAILAGMAEGVAVVGSDQRLIFCNAAFRKAVDIRSASLEGRPAVEVIRHSDLLAFILKALAGNTTVAGEVTVGSVRTKSFAVTAAPIRSNGTTAGAVMVLHDISELRRLERARRDFVANVSHEFKTPLTAIQGFAETLLGGALEDEQNSRRFLEIIREHALRLSRLTDDLLKLAQIEAGKFNLEARPVSVAEAIVPCLETARMKAALKNLVVEAEFDRDLPLIMADLRSLQEILENLLDNAVRYSLPGGHIWIKAAVEESEVTISVSDTGIGIPRAEQERIFERFYRADAARSRESGGTGLGLAIVKHLVEAHSGRIRVRSEVGRGSTFLVSFPCLPAGSTWDGPLGLTR